MPVLDMYFNCKELGGEHMTIASAVIAVVGVLVMHGRSSYFRIFYQIINHDGSIRLRLGAEFQIIVG